MLGGLSARPNSALRQFIRLFRGDATGLGNMSNEIGINMVNAGLHQLLNTRLQSFAGIIGARQPRCFVTASVHA